MGCVRVMASAFAAKAEKRALCAVIVEKRGPAPSLSIEIFQAISSVINMVQKQ
jgi:hypothetical protein